MADRRGPLLPSNGVRVGIVGADAMSMSGEQWCQPAHAGRRTIGTASRTITIALLVATMSAMPTAPAAAQTGPEQNCIDLVDETWDAAAMWVWEELCAGRSADLSAWDGADQAPDSSEDSEDETRTVIPADFLHTVLTAEPYRSALADRPMRIAGAWFVDPLDLSDLVRSSALALEHSRFDHPFKLEHAHLAARFSVMGSDFASSLSLGGSDLASLDLTDATAPMISLNNLGVDHDVTAIGTRATVFEANAATVGGSVALREGCFHEVSLISATVGIDVALDGASFHDIEKDGDGTAVLCAREFPLLAAANFCADTPADRDLEADGLLPAGLHLDAATVGGSVYLRQWPVGPADAQRGCFQDVTLLGAHVGGDIDTLGSRFFRRLRLNGADVRGTVRLRFATFHGDVDLETASLDGDVTVEAATFEGPVSLFGSEVGGTLILGHNEEFPIVWEPGSRLTLTGTRTIAVSDLTPPDATSPDVWPTQLDLEGFIYESDGRQAGFLNRDLDWYAEWLARDTSLPRQPYNQLERALRAAGRDDVADGIAILLRDRQLDQQDWIDGNWIDKPLRSLWGATVGYGYAPQRALWWIGSLVLLGWLAALAMGSRTRAVLGVGNPLTFSVARAIPFPRFGAAHDVDLSSRLIAAPLRWYFVVHTIAGYIIPLFVISQINSFLT